MGERNKWIDFAIATLFLFFPTVFYAMYYVTGSSTTTLSARISSGLMFGLFFQVCFAIAALVVSAVALQLMKVIFKDADSAKLKIDMTSTSLVYINASCIVAMVCVQRKLPFI